MILSHLHKLMFGLLISLAVSCSLQAQNFFDFKYYNTIDQTFILEDWKMYQLIKESEENVKLKLEVNAFYIKDIAYKNKIATAYKQIQNLSSQLAEKDDIISDLNTSIMYKDDLYDKCLEANNSGNQGIDNLEWALKKEKVKNKYLEWSTGITLTALVAGIIISTSK